MDPALFTQSERFDIFKHTVTRNRAIGAPRDVYQAWFRDRDVPRPVALVVVFESQMVGRYVEWVEVTEAFRGLRVATEVLNAIEAKAGRLELEGVTPDGEAFVDAFERQR